jgi:AraC-like DNA-binding protein
MGIVFIIGIVQAFFIEFLLLNKKNKSLPDKILAFWMFVTGVHLFLYYLYYKGYHEPYPIVLGLSAPLPLIHGPFLFLYVSSLVNKKQVFNRLNLLHFIPMLSYYLFLMPVFLDTAEGQQKFVFEVLPNDPPFYLFIFSIMIDLSGIIYISLSLVLLRNHQKFISENYSFEEHINLRWLRNLIIGMALIWITVLVGNFLTESEGSVLIYGMVVVFIFIIGYFGIKQGSIFTTKPSAIERSEPEKPNPDKYQKSSLDAGRADKYLKKLLSCMEEDKPYLESRLTLPQLAEKLGIHQNYLSQVINEKLDQNFYLFINSYRVNEFMQRVKEDETNRFTFLAHAYESGFSSKSAFNEVFKKITGMTPSEYKKQISSQDT